MCKIPFSDPIWDRLYGAYEAHSCPDTLRSLCADWSQERANALFWEDLYHQGSLYPLTYAALPWLWETAPRTLDNLYFFSTIVAAAYASDEGYAGAPPFPRKWNGLPLHEEAHHHSYRPKETWLTKGDMLALSNLQNWFELHAEDMAMSAYRSIQAGNTQHEVAYLSEGFCAIKGCSWANGFLQMLADECDDEELDEALPEMEVSDLEMLMKLAAHLDRSHPDFAKQIRMFASPVLEQTGRVERDQNTPDLFD
ncbi:hypothetical protein RSK20926_14299 [Roseobacter sp. SK209-2-6]|uniref:hypothetical protein n=1 Tax=Roseobacter sp. SK209-2-6 TaxID=388739 RepID=UPI0000F3D4D9|nr:hypothetical protein [Roseobacter sp. SK209-2-6]EBA15809.1 hypothetical protein RSK20926_14299 [Roseobacter sp. SK209-2-6]